MKKVDDVEKIEWYENIPVNINNNGDPLIENTIDNTILKIKSLEGYGNIYHICSKAVPSERAFKLLESLSENQKRNAFITYSLTGLNEGGFTFEQRVETIKRLYSIFGNLTILLRPLIRGKNDSHENIERIIKVASKFGNKIILGGLHNEKLIKQIKDSTEGFFYECCKEYGVKYFNKTSCAVQDTFGIECKVHGYFDSNPINLDILDRLGYEYTIWNGKVLLEQASSGDLNLVRIITKSLPHTKRITSILNKISVDSDHNYEFTSGWMSWSENNPCSIGCKYCVMSQIDYLTDRSSVGCHPKDANNFKIDSAYKDNIVDYEPLDKYYSYKDIRRQCECIKYDK